MNSNTAQTPIEQPSPSADNPTIITVTPDEAAILQAYRDANGAKMLDLYVEKHAPPPLPDDYAFPHDATFADQLIADHYPDATFLAVQDYREKYGVDRNIAQQAIERIFEKAKAAGLTKDETRLIAAYRAGDTDSMKHLAYKSHYANQPEPESTGDPYPTLNFEQRMAVIIMGDLAKRAYLYQWMIKDEQYLPGLIQTISESIGEGMEHMDAEEVKRFYVSPGSDWPSSQDDE